MEKIFERIKKLLFGTTGKEIAIIRNMAKLAGGDGIARFIGILTIPLITRIYLPEHLGVLAIFTALVSLIAPLCTLRYSSALPLPKNDGVAINIAVISGVILMGASLLSFIVFYFLGDTILVVISMKQLIPYWFLIPIAVAGAGIYELFLNWGIRERAFYPLAKAKVWQKIIGSISKVGLGLAGLKPLGLLIGHIFTQAGGIIALSRVFIQKFSSNLKYVSKRRLVFVSKRYSDFPKYRVPSQFLLILSGKIILFYFAWHFGAEIAGLISLAIMVLMLPISLIGYTTGKAYYAEIAKIGTGNSEEILSITKSICLKLLMFSFIPFLMLFLLGPWMFDVVFGNEWYNAGVYASILSIYLLVQFVYSPIGEGVFNVFEKQFLVFMIETGRLFITIVAFYISYMLNWGPNSTLILYSIALSAHYLLATWAVFFVLRKELTIH